MSLPNPGTWFKHCLFEDGGRYPFYIQFLHEQPYTVNDRVLITVRLETGLCLTFDSNFLDWLELVTQEDRKPKVKLKQSHQITKPQQPLKVSGGGIAAKAASAEPQWESTGPIINTEAMWPRLMRKEA